jgi:transposase
MSKYTSEIKLQAIKMVIEKNLSFGEVSRIMNISKSEIQKWVAAYKAHGIAGIEKERMSYSGEFKQMVVENMHANNLSLRQTAAKYNLGNHKIPANWERIYLEEGPEGLYIERRGRLGSLNGVKKGRSPKFEKKVEEDLIAEVQRLRMENDYLKKLNALVREQTQPKNKKLK